MTVPKAGDIWSYEYLWRREHDHGAENGRKPRPTALVAMSLGADGYTNLFILPITTKEPGKDRLALEIPQIERRRAGLDFDRRLWVIIDEYNHDILETSFHFDPNGKQGAFSSVFTTETLRLFVRTAKAGRVKKVPRRD